MTNSFSRTLKHHNLQLTRAQTQILQINIGRVCNLACKHCHVSAGPGRKEIMSRETMAQVIDFAKHNTFETADITGGAPEMVPGIDELITGLHPLVNSMIFRSNLTLLLSDKHKDLFTLLLSKKISLVTSFPSTNQKQADSQRGDGVWQSCIDALKKLNDVGYGVLDPV